MDQLIRRRLEPCGPRLFSEGRSRVEVVLGQLVVPELIRWHTHIVVNPIDKFLFGVKPAALDKIPSRERVQQ